MELVVFKRPPNMVRLVLTALGLLFMEDLRREGKLVEPLSAPRNCEEEWKDLMYTLSKKYVINTNFP
jgi:hypothetical protein